MTRHRLLVTGLRGFVGSVLAARVQERPDASDISLAPLARSDGDVIDLRNADAVAQAVATLKPTAVLHLAAIASPRIAADDPADAWAVNLTGTFNLAQAVRTHVANARFIFAGSSEAYGTSFMDNSAPLGETNALQPISVYGATKAAADIMLAQMARDGLGAVRFRPFNHTGPGQTSAYAVSAFARQIVRIERGWQEPVISVGNLDAQRDFLDVRDVVDAYLSAALDDPLPVGAFNLATGSPVAISTMLRALTALSPAAIDVAQNPELMRTSELPIMSGDPSRARSILGWEPKIPLQRTLSDVLDHWRAVADTTPAVMCGSRGSP